MRSFGEQGVLYGRNEWNTNCCSCFEPMFAINLAIKNNKSHRKKKNKLSRIIIFFIYIGGIMIFSSFGESKETKFWKWFTENEVLLYNLENNQERVFNRLNKELYKINRDLTFEFGPKMKNEMREFVISAGGIKNAFPSVEKLSDSAPKLKHFQIIKFRQRKDIDGSIEFGGLTVNSDQVTYQLVKDEDKIGILLFFTNYDEKLKDIYGNIGFLYLDAALGEFDIETKVGLINFLGTASEYFEGSKKLELLPPDFDEQYRNLKK